MFSVTLLTGSCTVTPGVPGRTSMKNRATKVWFSGEVSAVWQPFSNNRTGSSINGRRERII